MRIAVFALLLLAVAAIPYACDGGCDTASDCAFGESCFAGQCLPALEAACNSDADCGPFECLGGFCGIAACLEDSDCPTGFDCVGGSCAITPADMGTTDLGPDLGGAQDMGADAGSDMGS
ncbi:MAG: hypothetical protein ACFB9M_06080 [Myxococcota bacterium]